MKIDDRKNPKPKGSPLSSFSLGDCIRLADDIGEGRSDRVYIVAAVIGRGHVATNLYDGCFRQSGQFVLEPNAKVVIE